MILHPVTEFTPEALVKIKEIIPEDAGEFLSQSKELFEVTDSGLLLAYAGTFARTLIGNEVYWWIALVHTTYSPRQLRYCVSEVKRLLSLRPECHLAEACVQRVRDQKFLQFCGFVEIARSDERILYEWKN